MMTGYSVMITPENVMMRTRFLGAMGMFYFAPSKGGETAGKDMTMSRFFNITTSDDGTSTIFLYGDIGDYTEVQSGRIAQELMEAERVSRRIHVRINSNGGEVYSGIAIFNALRHSQADIRIYVDGIAASMASVIALLRQARRNEQICPSDAAQCERRVLRQQAGPAALHGRDRKPGRQLE